MDCVLYCTLSKVLYNVEEPGIEMTSALSAEVLGAEIEVIGVLKQHLNYLMLRLHLVEGH